MFSINPKIILIYKQPIKIKINMKNLKQLSKESMKEVNGGLKWTNDRGCNVIDLRDGAPPVW